MTNYLAKEVKCFRVKLTNAGGDSHVASCKKRRERESSFGVRNAGDHFSETSSRLKGLLRGFPTAAATEVLAFIMHTTDLQRNVLAFFRKPPSASRPYSPRRIRGRIGRSAALFFSRNSIMSPLPGVVSRTVKYDRGDFSCATLFLAWQSAKQQRADVSHFPL